MYAIRSYYGSDYERLLGVLKKQAMQPTSEKFKYFFRRIKKVMMDHKDIKDSIKNYEANIGGKLNLFVTIISSVRDLTEDPDIKAFLGKAGDAPSCGAEVKTGVITSYSIHYTKLYEETGPDSAGSPHSGRVRTRFRPGTRSPR